MGSKGSKVDLRVGIGWTLDEGFRALARQNTSLNARSRGRVDG